MILETERLCLLPPDHVNVNYAVDYFNRNRQFLKEFEPERQEEYYSFHFQKKLLFQQNKDWRERRSYRFYISPKYSGGLIIGYVALNGVAMGAFCSCYLSYQLDYEFLNYGFMTEAVEEVIRYAFSIIGLHRIEGNIMPRNIPSIRVVEKCGFVYEGVSRKYLKINGVWEDHVHYAKLNEAME